MSKKEKYTPLTQDQIDGLAMRAAVDEFANEMVEMGKVYMLTSTEKVACKKGEEYFWVSHTGGETFRFNNAYATAQGIIVCLTPEDAANYDSIEMKLGDAESSLAGFATDVRIVDFDAMIKNEVVKIVDEDREKVAELRKQEYNDYGSW